MIDGEEALLAESAGGHFENIGQLMLYRPIRSQDVEVIERAARDKYKAKCREVRSGSVAHDSSCP